MKDEIIRFLAYEGRVNVKCINSKEIVEQARKSHDLSPTATAALGRLLTMASMMGVTLKEKSQSITIQIKGNGPLGIMVAVSDCKGKVKGYVGNPNVELSLNQFGKLDVGGAVGKEGFIHIIKDLNLKEPYIGMTPIITGEIAEDFTNYFATSEQTPSVIALGVLVDKNGVKAAGGYQISLMPDATEEDIQNIEKAVNNADSISKMLDKELNLVEIAKMVTGDENIKLLDENTEIAYSCNCSREKIEKGLIAIGKEELQQIIDKDGKAETVCNFCNKQYYFSKEELEKLIENK